MSVDFIRFRIDARSFLARARQRLAEFDAGRHEALFYAALDLRYGIEARLHTYVDAALRLRGEATARQKEYTATALLARLKQMNPDAERACTLAMRLDDSTTTGVLVFTPVTPRLASMHGRLGELLHAKFFRNNPAWVISRQTEGNGLQSLPDYRRFLAEVEAELAEATRGTLTGHPVFTELINEAMDSASDGDPATG